MSAMLREAGLLKELEAAKERIRQLEAQSVAVVGEPVAWVHYRDHNGRRPTTIHLCDSDSQGAFEVIRKPTHSIPAAELATLREKAARLEHELETERMRLAACGVIAMANTVDSAAKARDMLPEYWSASAQDCASAVDREMDYRSRLVVAERERDELRKALQIAFQHIDKETHCNDHAKVAAALAQGKGE